MGAYCTITRDHFFRKPVSQYGVLRALSELVAPSHFAAPHHREVALAEVVFITRATTFHFMPAMLLSSLGSSNR